MPNDAPYTGGLSPGATQFAVDGDFTSSAPCSPPKVTFPLKGDSIFSNQDLIYYDPTSGDYAPVPLGTFPNLKPWNPSQVAFVIEQDFMVALEAYVPLALNTPYDQAAWWPDNMPRFTSTNYPLPELSAAFLVDEGEPQDMGQGIVKITRKFASLPPTRSETEQFVYQFPGFDSTNNGQRPSFTRNVISRLQYDYFVFDDLDLLSIPLFPNGNRLDATTGLYPDNLILEPQFYYASGGVSANIFLDNTPPAPSLQDGGIGASTIPSATDWVNWLQGIGTSTTTPPELIAEGSTMSRWMGNIFVRRTRMVLVQ